MALGLTTVWAHPHQACLPSLDEAVRKLTLLINIGDNWVYTFMQLNKGTLHVPLLSKGHISTMINGVLSRSACMHLCQLQEQRLLQCRSHMVCPEGIKGGLEPVQLSIPQPPMWDMNTLVGPVHDSLQLQVDLPQAMLSDKIPFFPGPCKVSTPPSSHIWLWKVLVKWLTIPAWPPSFKNSCLRWCWTPLAQPQGTAP